MTMINGFYITNKKITHIYLGPFMDDFSANKRLDNLDPKGKKDLEVTKLSQEDADIIIIKNI